VRGGEAERLITLASMGSTPRLRTCRRGVFLRPNDPHATGVRMQAGERDSLACSAASVREQTDGRKKMMNRLQMYLEPDEPECAPEYFFVRGTFGCAYVSRATARYIIRQVERWLRPRWTRFTDLSGSEICVPTRGITLVSEATPAQRETDRKLRKLLEKEENEGEWS
jgi:hypothetical protein